MNVSGNPCLLFLVDKRFNIGILAVSHVESGYWDEDKPFMNCDNLVNVTIGNGLTAIPELCFNNCTKLQSVTIGEAVVNIGYAAFSNCNALTSIYIPKSVKEIGVRCFMECDSLAVVTLSYGLNKICGGAFYNCDSLTEIIIPSSVSIIESGYRDEDKAFGGCQNLVKLVIPNSVTTIGESILISSDNAIIYGYEGSVAAKYATDYNLKFQPLEAIVYTSLTFSSKEVSVLAGQKILLDYEIDPIDTSDAITWKSSDTSIVSVDNMGMVTAYKSGSVSIIATTTSGFRASITLIVGEAPKTLSFKNLVKTIAKDETYTQKAIVDDGSRTDVSVTYTSSDTDIATVSANGKVTPTAQVVLKNK